MYSGAQQLMYVTTAVKYVPHSVQTLYSNSMYSNSLCAAVGAPE